ncbi:hypothetical protein [Jatrophihabitans endophyticus]|uniref:hypothetical protein n=1 Tax=Jatrophihabitans endophyticus TaxID=1206085 RepID=UPI0019F5E825|nr:hypothetical protein [Jatrophihabitans endophyticus]MBE7186878.1 hypothetical protein [Jatrophihabitans endophyticus]
MLDGELSGFVDFDVVCYGDPMYWLALSQVAMTHDVGDAGLFYLHELRRLWGLTPREAADLALYSAVHACAFLYRNGSNRRAFGRLRHACERWLAEAVP